MKQIAPTLLLTATLALPAAAQDQQNDGLSLMEEGAKLFFKGILQEMEPALGEMQDFALDLGPEIRDFALSMGPALRELLDEIDDWSVYHPPEMLPNGDIIIRRKTPEPKDDTTLGTEIEL